MLKIAVFRPENRKKEVESMSSMGFEVLYAPLIRTEVNLDEVERVKKSNFDVAVVTSVTAANIIQEYGLLELIRGKRVIAIGKRTAKVLESVGIKCELPERFDSASIVKQFKEELKGKRVALFRSDKGDPVLLEIGDADEFKIYNIKEVHGKEQERIVEKIAEGYVDVVIFSSRMMVKSFVNLCKKIGKNVEILNGVRVIAIGPPTAKELESFGIKAEIPDEYTFEGILRLLKR